ncbi:MAG: hypothetical protein FWC34_07015, partial [Bacteroidetes bacterium]|nr:hypothetical protein [Bacteroidota bacterium]MCL2302869.1 hypothetical protein [Lentimicrobiaceae bacterium]
DALDNELSLSTPLANGTYKAIYRYGTGSNTCESTDTTTFIVTLNNTPVTAPDIADQFFCEGATIANIIVPNDGILWYNVAAGGTPLPATTILITGTYYAAQNMGGSCGAGLRAPVVITIDNENIPNTATYGPYSFCGTIQLGELLILGYGITWYADQTGGLPLPLSTVITSTTTYWVAQQGNGDCASDVRAEVIIEERCKVTLDLKVFLQGPTVNGNYTFKGEAKNGPHMTNQIQVPRYPWFTTLRLPVTDPYGLSASYPQINSITGPAYEVVDWVLVEIWGNFNETTYTYDFLESRALLLQIDGSVVDVNGELPEFNIQQGNVRIVVRHRNHVGVASNIGLPFTSDTARFDFTTGINKAYTLPFPGVPNQMTMKHGVACLWAGDLNLDYVLNATDVNIFNNTFYFVSGVWEYVRPDLNMDGIVDAADSALLLDNFYLRSVYSVLRFFIKN